jgi:hypothetical protein
VYSHRICICGKTEVLLSSGVELLVHMDLCVIVFQNIYTSITKMYGTTNIKFIDFFRTFSELLTQPTVSYPISFL